MTDPGALTTGGTKANAQLVYILYLVGLLTGGLTALVGIVMAYVGKPDASDWLQSHYRFMVRSFWIGLAYVALASIATGALIATVILSPLAFLLGAVAWLFTLVWWIVRCVQGLDYLNKNQSIPKPESWMFAS